MSSTRYSNYFSCLYDEQHPVNNFGQGAHYSVMRALEWLDVCRDPLTHAQVHDFAVIWDKDHDTRIIRVLERILVAGLLSPVRFIGERGAVLTVIVAPQFRLHANETGFKNYLGELQDICRRVDGEEFWAVSAGMFDSSPNWTPEQAGLGELIEADVCSTLAYLRGIDTVWQIGAKAFSRISAKEFMLTPPPWFARYR